MNISILIKPYREDLKEFFSVRGFDIEECNPNILLYTGNSNSELRRLMKKTSADVALVNNIQPLNEKFIWVYNEFNTVEELVSSTFVLTNSTTMAKEIYSALGIQLVIKQVEQRKSIKLRCENVFVNIAEKMQWR